MKPNYFDIHSHIQERRFEEDREAVIERMEEAGVWSIVVGVDYESSKKAVELATLHEGLYASIGLHPTDVVKEDFEVERYRTLAENKKVVSIGECGLDYLRAQDESREEKKRQRKRFEEQIDLAVELDKPLMVHSREAYDDTLDILTSKKQEYGDALRGNIHFFSGDVAILKRYLNLNFTVSFTGVITFTHDYDEVVRFVPLSHIMSETDCPYVAPVPYRGGRNEPSYVVEVARRIAEIRGEDFEKVESALVENAMRIFDIKKL